MAITEFVTINDNLRQQLRALRQRALDRMVAEIVARPERVREDDPVPITDRTAAKDRWLAGVPDGHPQAVHIDRNLDCLCCGDERAGDDVCCTVCRAKIDEDYARAYSIPATARTILDLKPTQPRPAAVDERSSGVARAIDRLTSDSLRDAGRNDLVRFHP